MNLASPKFMAVLGLLGVVLVWQWLATLLSPMILSSFDSSVEQLMALVSTKQFWSTLGISLWRLAWALGLAALVGLFLGGVSARKPRLKYFLEPLRWCLMSVPPVIVVLLAMLWFGMGNQMVVFIVVLLLTPSIYIHAQKGVEQIDPQWLELAKVYQFSLWQQVIKIYLPAMSAPLCIAMVTICCSGVRILVLAEVLGTHEGIGYELANARSHFAMTELYAWVLVCLLLVACLEFCLLRPVQHYLLRWRQC